MAAEFTEVTLDDMDRFLKRAFRPFRPKQSNERGRIVYDLNLSDNEIFIRVWTSIRPNQAQGVGVGEGAIKVNMVSKNGRPLMPKNTIVKRTQKWRSSLQSRIEDVLEAYESKTEYWKNRAEGQSAPKPVDTKPDEPLPEPQTQVGDVHEGQFTKLRNGDWGAKIFGKAGVGDTAILSTRGGKRLKVILDVLTWKGKDRYGDGYVEIWTFSTGRDRYAMDEQGKQVELAPLLLTERYMSARCT